VKRDGACVSWFGDGLEVTYRSINYLAMLAVFFGFGKVWLAFCLIFVKRVLYFGKIHTYMIEQTLVLVKPDGVQRSLIGEIIGRLEKTGLKVVALKMVTPTKDQADRHYALTEEWMQMVYSKAKAKYEANNEPFAYPDYKAYGQSIKDGLVTFLASGPVVAMVLEGEMAVSLTRKIVGATEPASSAPGTIRGDLSFDTYALSNTQNRPLRNLIHASGNIEEAKTEAPIWFAAEEICKVNGALDPVFYDEKRFK